MPIVTMTLRTARVLAYVCGMFAALPCSADHPANQPVSLDQYQLTTWDTKDGTPSNIRTLAQTKDGWIWVGGPSGLFRFDGIRFTRVELNLQGSNRSPAVSALFAMDSGQLLIGRLNGGISVFENGSVRDYRFDPQSDHQSGSTVLSFAENKDGELWAATRTGLVRFDGKTWTSAAADWGLLEVRFECLYVDHSGVLWASTPTEVLRLPRGGRLFQSVGVAVSESGCFFEAPDGRGWVGDNDGARVLPGQVAGRESDRTSNSRASMSDFFSRDSRFWTTFDWNNRTAGIPQTVSGVDKLPGGPHTMLEDREGNVWIATGRNVLHRLRRKVLMEAASPPAPERSRVGFALDVDGVAWVTFYSGSSVHSNKHDGLYRYDGHTMDRIPQPSIVSIVKRSADGAIWVAGGKGLWRRNGRAFVQVAQLPDSKDSSYVRALAINPNGDVWVSILGGGLFRSSKNGWVRNGGVSSLPVFEPEVIDYDSAGKLWLGYRDGGVIVVDGERAHVAATAKETRLGAVTAIGLGARVLVGGDAGLAILRNGHFLPVRADSGRAFDIVTGISQTTTGDVWVNCDRGAVRISAKALDGPILDGELRVGIEVFDTVDGYPKTGTSISNLASMATGPDGRVWLSYLDGLAWLDPNALSQNSEESDAVIENIAANGRVTDATGPVHLEKGTQNVRFDYTGLDYSHPDRLRFRYRLVGHESEWVEAGPRRQAFYTNLGPANYRFEVQTANESGHWSQRPAALEFEIPPTFTQTLAFRLLCGAGGLLLVLVLYRMRVRQITFRQEERLLERVGERERIARALHDTLLQSTQGLILSFQTQVQQIDTNDPTKAELERTLLRANEVLNEGRDRVQDLRVPEDTSTDLSSALACVGEQLKAGHPASFKVVVEGTVRELQSVARDEAYHIGREALLNAFRHSKATSIEVQIIYDDSVLSVRIRDDGVGIESRLIRHGAPNHWGLKGMRERANELGGKLDIWTRTSGGTEVELAIPAHGAYKNPSRRVSWLSRLWPQSLR